MPNAADLSPLRLLSHLVGVVCLTKDYLLATHKDTACASWLLLVLSALLVALLKR